jgi:RNA polymerase sigma-70 factor (ECF subfamily)
MVPYLPRLFGYAVSLTLDRDAARDLVQDCALKALEARRVPADEPAFRAWLFTIVRNAFLDGRRRLDRSPEVEIEDHDDAAFAGGHDDSLINAISVRVGMTRLSREHREILALIDVAGFSYGEAATVLDVPAGTVMSRVSRARRALLKSVVAGNVHALERPRRRRAR